jgi:uncharacterized protein
MNLYFDTSALIKRYVSEAGSTDVREWIRSTDDKATTLVTRAEMSAAFNRMLRMRHLTQADYDDALGQFRADWMDFHRLPVTETLVALADALACEFILRGYDAIHLAAARTWQNLLELPVTVVTYDRELSEAARESGMAVLP